MSASTSTTNLDKHLENKARKLQQLEDSLAALHLQLQNIQQELRVETQLHTAQQKLAKEFNTQKQAMIKLFKDSCSIFEVEAIDDMLDDLKGEAEKVKEEYENYKDSDRFLNAETAAEQDQEILKIEEAPSTILPTLEGDILPPEGDDIMELVPDQILVILKTPSITPAVIERLKSTYWIHGKTKSLVKIAESLSNHKLTRYKLEQFISLFSDKKEIEVDFSTG